MEAIADLADPVVGLQHPTREHRVEPGGELIGLEKCVGATVASVTKTDAVDVGADPLELGDLSERLVVEQHRDGSGGEIVIGMAASSGTVT